MTGDDLRTNIRLEVDRAEQALAAAVKLQEARLFADSASRAYYAAFHYARALCWAAGVEPKTHQGVGHLLALHYVRPGTLPADTARLFAALQRWREAADYDAAFVLDAPGADDVLAMTRTLVERARAWLRGAGLLPS